MAAAVPDSITRRSMVAGPLAGVTALASCVPAGALARHAEAATDPIHAAIAYVRLLHERDDYPMLDDFGCYALIASAETALRPLGRGCVSA